jgi:hypothetical protein
MTLNSGLYHILIRLSIGKIPLSSSVILPIWIFVIFRRILFRESTGESLFWKVYSMERIVSHVCSLSKQPLATYVGLDIFICLRRTVWRVSCDAQL